MKSILFVISIFCSQLIFGQLKTSTAICPTFSVDILEGIINNRITTKSTLGQVKNYFPCFTDIMENPVNNQCGGIFYKDKDIYFFNDRGYIEIREKFRGNLIPALMGVNRTGLFNLLGNPIMKDINWDAFQTKYGILILYYNKANKIFKLQISYKTTSTIKLCD